MRPSSGYSSSIKLYDYVQESHQKKESRYENVEKGENVGLEPGRIYSVEELVKVMWFLSMGDWLFEGIWSIWVEFIFYKMEPERNATLSKIRAEEEFEKLYKD